MFILDHIKYEIYKNLYHQEHLNSLLCVTNILNVLNGTTIEQYPHTKQHVMDYDNNQDARATVFYDSRGYTARINNELNPDMDGPISILSLYNIIYTGVAISQLNYNLENILNLLNEAKEYRYNLNSTGNYTTRIDSMFKHILKPDVYKLMYSIYKSIGTTRITETDFEEQGYVKVDTELWNLIVAKAIERDDNSPEVFKELYYSEAEDNYIFYTNAADTELKKWTASAAYLYAICNDEIVKNRLSESAYALLEHCLNIFKYKRVTKGEALAEKITQFMEHDELVKVLKKLIHIELLKDNIITKLTTAKENLLRHNQDSYRRSIDECIRLENSIKELERDLFIIKDQIPKIAEEFLEFISHKEITHYNLTEENELIFTITTPMDFVELELVEMLRTTYDNHLAVDMLKNLYEEANGFIYGTTTFRLNLDSKSLRLHSSQPLPSLMPTGTIINPMRSGNPHHTGYSCLGTFQRQMDTAANNMDFIGIFNICLAAVKNFNVADSAVLSRFNDLLKDIKYDGAMPEQCMVDYNGEMLNYTAYLNTTEYEATTEFDREDYDEDYEEDDERTDEERMDEFIQDICYNIRQLHQNAGDSAQTTTARLRTIFDDMTEVDDYLSISLEELLDNVEYIPAINQIDLHKELNDDYEVYDALDGMVSDIVRNLAAITLNFVDIRSTLETYVARKIAFINAQFFGDIPSDIAQRAVAIQQTQLSLETRQHMFETLQDIDWDSNVYGTVRANLAEVTLHTNHDFEFNFARINRYPTPYFMTARQTQVYKGILQLAKEILPARTTLNDDMLLNTMMTVMLEAIPPRMVDPAADVLEDVAEVRRLAANRIAFETAPREGGVVVEYPYLARDERIYIVAQDMTGAIGTELNGTFIRFESIDAFEQHLARTINTDDLQRAAREMRRVDTTNLTTATPWINGAHTYTTAWGTMVTPTPTIVYTNEGTEQVPNWTAVELPNPAQGIDAEAARITAEHTAAIDEALGYAPDPAQDIAETPQIAEEEEDFGW